MTKETETANVPALQKAAPPQNQQLAPTSFAPQTFEQLVTFGKMVANSDFAPKAFRGKPENCMLAIQTGAEVGLSPMQALQSIAVVNGVPCVFGDAMLGLVQSSGLLEYISESGDEKSATCKVKRVGMKHEIVQSFTLQEANKAGLTGKSGPWQQYPKRMLQMRARGFALRDGFPDVLKGLRSDFEAHDIREDAPAGFQSERTEPPPPPVFPQDRFEKNLPNWRKAIIDGKITAAGVIERASAIGRLTPAQERAIKDCEVTDVTPQEPAKKPPARQPAAQQATVVDVTPRPPAGATPAPAAEGGGVEFDLAWRNIKNAKTRDELIAATHSLEYIRGVEPPEKIQFLEKLVDQRFDELNALAAQQPAPPAPPLVDEDDVPF